MAGATSAASSSSPSAARRRRAFTGTSPVDVRRRRAACGKADRTADPAATGSGPAVDKAGDRAPVAQSRNAPRRPSNIGPSEATGPQRSLGTHAAAPGRPSAGIRVRRPPTPGTEPPCCPGARTLGTTPDTTTLQSMAD
jgi:hypothetical protein